MSVNNDQMLVNADGMFEAVSICWYCLHVGVNH